MPVALNLEKVISLSDLDVSADVAMFEGLAVPAPAGTDLPQVLRVDQSTTFKFSWTRTGALLPWFDPSQVKFDVFYELMGPGEAVIAVPTATTTTLSALSTTLTLAANSVPAGVYRVVVRMMLLPPVGATPTKICGFAELDLVEYYDI